MRSILVLLAACATPSVDEAPDVWTSWDSQAPPPVAITIEALSDAVAGEALTLRATLPGQAPQDGLAVHFVTGTGLGDGACPGPLNGECLSVTGFTYEGSGTTSAGVAELSVTVPASGVLAFQAVVLHNGNAYLGSAAEVAIETAEAGPPNVLFVILDDLGLDMASFDSADPCYAVGDTTNDPVMPTLAGLCSESVKFTNMWGSPTCSPFRAAALTGTHAYQHGVTGPATQTAKLDLDTFTLPDALAESGEGWSKASIGKWHLGGSMSAPNDAGWDHYSGVTGGSVPDYYAWTRVTNGTSEAMTTYATSQTIDDAISWLETVDTTAPWFLWLAFNAPHTPIHLPPDGLYVDDTLADYTPNADDLPYSAAMSEAMDTELGRLMTWLDEAGEGEETVIVLVGDNGSQGSLADDPPYGNGSKGTLYEGGLAIPLMVSGPGIADVPRSESRNVTAPDLFPTLLELAGVDVDAAATTHGLDLDGVSFAGCLGDSADCASEPYTMSDWANTMNSSNDDGAAIRNDTHKLICSLSAQPEMFELTDNRENTDVWDVADPTYIELRDELRAWTGDDTRCLEP